jgi:hypothetical protein
MEIDARNLRSDANMSIVGHGGERNPSESSMKITATAMV